MKTHAPGQWFRTNAKKVIDRETGSESYDVGIVVMDQRGKPQCIGEFFGFSGPFARQDAVANAERVVVCVNALNGFVDPVDTVMKMREAMERAEHLSKAFLELLEMIPEENWTMEHRNLRELQTS